MEKENRFVFDCLVGGFFSYNNSDTGARCAPINDLNKIETNSTI